MASRRLISLFALVLGRRAQVIWKLVFKIYRKSGAFKRKFDEPQ